MTHLESGMLIHHTSLGVGKVVALEPGAVHVFFESCETRYATKLKLPLAMGMLSAVEGPDSGMLGPLRFAFDDRAQRYGVAPVAVPGKARKSAVRKKRPSSIPGGQS